MIKSCTSCKHCGMDMDMEPYCVHPKVIAIGPYGINTNRIRGTKQPDDAKNWCYPAAIGLCGPDAVLFEER